MNAQESVISNPYLIHGVELDPQAGELRIDTQKPRAITVRAIDELTGTVKVYMLRVTSKHGLCLV